MDSKSGNLGNNLTYQFQLVPKNFELQNRLSIKVTDGANNQLTEEVIVFK